LLTISKAERNRAFCVL